MTKLRVRNENRHNVAVMRTGIAISLALAALLPLAPAASARGSSIAPPSACPGQTHAGAPEGEQLRAMLCMTNYARAAAGLKPLHPSHLLGHAAAAKAADILRCDEFSHEACGRAWTYWLRHFGYLHGCWRAAENIAWGTGSAGSVREIFSSWMHSAGHRENILGPSREIGIGRRVGAIDGHSGAVVWTQDFGSHVC